MSEWFFLFPGQGSQAPGMGKDFYENSTPARDALDEAESMLGPGFLEILFTGSADELRDTRVAQTALVSVGVAISRHLMASGVAPGGVAGHSVGEIAALITAGSISFIDGLKLTRERARLMAEEAPPGTMAAVLGLEPAVIAASLPLGVEIANFNGPSQTIISGSLEGIEAAQVMLKEAGAKRVIPLNVSGAFHSPLMALAAHKLALVIRETDFKTPAIPFVSSVSGTFETDPERIRELLGRQVSAPVQWTKVMETIGGKSCLEVAPGNVLQGLAKRMPGGPVVSPAGTLELASTAV